MSPAGRRLAAASYSFLVVMVGTTLPTPLYELYQQAYGFSGLVVTFVFAAYAVGVIAALLLVGQASDRVGRRPVLLAGIGAAAASSVVFLLAGGTGWLFVGRVLSGVSAGIFTGTATTALTELAPDEDEAAADGRARRLRDRAPLLATAANILGLGLGPLVAGVLVRAAPGPLRLPFALHLVLLVPAVVLTWRQRETVPDTGSFRLQPLSMRVPPEVRGTFVPVAISSFAGFAAFGLFTSVEPRMLRDVVGVDDALVGGVAVFVVFISSFAAQVLSVRLPEGRVLPLGCAALVAGMGLLVASLTTGSFALLIAADVVTGAGQGLAFRPGIAAIGRSSPPGARGRVTSTLFVVLYVGISIPVVAVGLVASAAGIATAAIALSAVTMALALTAGVAVLRHPLA